MNTVLVANVYKRHGTTLLSMPADALLEDILRALVNDRPARGIFLVDSKQRFAGMVTMVDLLRWVHLKLTGGRGRRGITVSEFYRLVDARRARDLASGDPQMLSVTENDTLQVALDRMLDREEDVIAVVDADRRIVGDLSLSEVVWWVVTHGGRKTDPSGTPPSRPGE